jgi:hypothetical protein
MAGVANMTSQDDGAWGSRCSVGLNLSRTQAHSTSKFTALVSPLFYNPAAEGEVRDVRDDDQQAPGPAKMELSLNVGVQFGLTDATSDTALKFQGSLSF